MAGEAVVNKTAILGIGLAFAGLALLAIVLYCFCCRNKDSYPELTKWSTKVEEAQHQIKIQKAKESEVASMFSNTSRANTMYSNAVTTPGALDLDSSSNAMPVGYLNLNKGGPPAGAGRESTDMIPYSMTMNLSNGGARESTDLFPDAGPARSSNNVPPPTASRKPSASNAVHQTSDEFPAFSNANSGKAGVRDPMNNKFPDSVNLSNRQPNPMPANNAFPDSINLSNRTGAASGPPPPNTGRESTDMIPYSMTMNLSTGEQEGHPSPFDDDGEDEKSSIHDII